MYQFKQIYLVLDHKMLSGSERANSAEGHLNLIRVVSCSLTSGGDKKINWVCVRSAPNTLRKAISSLASLFNNIRRHKQSHNTKANLLKRQTNFCSVVGAGAIAKVRLLLHYLDEVVQFLI
jgi:hypothetical protein